MRQISLLVCVACLLCGCMAGASEMDRAISLRQQLLAADGCCFGVDITADYGDAVSLFSMDCQSDAEGTVKFTVTSPESISGICGTLAKNGGKLTFEDTALQFDLLADGLLSPVSTPWVLVNTLCSGYLRSVGMENGELRLTIDDSYREDALQLDVWLDENDLPLRADILCDGRRVLSASIRDFQIV